MQEELPCDIVGKCEAEPGERVRTNCIYCGKELIERNGNWYTWDAEFFTEENSQGSVE